MATPAQKSALNIVMGTITFGEPGNDSARVHDVEDVEAILDVFRSHGHSEIDTARTYTGGTSEQILGKFDLQSKGLKVETKLYPTITRGPGFSKISHTPEGLRTHLLKSLEALNVKSLEMWYLHGPDRTVPYEITMKAVNDLYKEGYFERFGISNFAAWEVAEIVYICRTNGYIQPTVYQGIYNAVHRTVEPELFPCLRKFGISFYEFNALGGGFFTGKYTSPDEIPSPSSRFHPEKRRGRNRTRYWKEPYFKANESIRVIAHKYGLTMTEIALRWVSHHSLMKRECGDSVLIGATSLAQIKQNLIDLEKGPLPDEVVKVLDETWLEVQAHASRYFH